MSDIRLNVKAKVTKDKSDTISKAKAIAKEMDNINKESKSISENIKDVFNKNAVVGWAKVIKDTFNFMLKATEKQTEYIENLNMMQVAFGDSAKAAENYIQKLSSATGFDQSGLTKQLGIFRQISSAMGYTSQMSDLLSTNLSKLSLDISSLYNVSTERAGKALESAITGQVRSIRSLTGADITQATLQQEAYARGINKSVTEMTRAEKTILIYLSLERQLANANGDLSRTINSVANQTKIFKDQIFMAGRQLGSFFIPILKSLLPILNGVLMAFNTITGALLGFFGIDASSMAKEFGIASSGLDEIELGLDGINKAGKEAKKSLRGFDKLNNITTPTSASGGAGAGGIGFVDKNLKEALKEYNLQLDKMRNKATEIRDEILKILGFHQELNEETGQWEWKYDGIKTTIKNLYEWFTKLNPKAKLLVGFITTLAGAKIVNSIGKLFNFFKNSVSPLKKLSDSFALIDKFNWKNISSSIDVWHDSLTGVEKLTTAIVGVGGLISGVEMFSDAMKKMKDEGINTSNTLESTFGGLLTVISGASAGAAIGGATGGIIGAIIGGVSLLASAIDTWASTTDKETEELFNRIDERHTKWKDSIEKLRDTYNKADAETNYYKKLRDELDTIVDKEGKIKDGYETRAKFITTTLSDALGIEIEIVDGVVQKYDDLKDTLDKVIEKKSAIIKLNALEAEAEEATKNIGQAIEDEAKAYDELQTAQDNLREKTDKLAHSYGLNSQQLYDYITGTKTAKDLADELGTTELTVKDNLSDVNIVFRKYINAIDKAKSKYKQASDTLNGYNTMIYNWEKATEYALDENYEALNYYFDHESKLYDKSIEEQLKYWEDYEDTYSRSLDNLERNRDRYDKNTYDSMKKNYEEQQQLAEEEMKRLQLLIDTKNGDLSDNIIIKWAEMGNNSVSAFTNSLEQLPVDIQKNIIDKMENTGVKINEELQKGLDKIKPTITIEAAFEGVGMTKGSSTEALKKMFNLKAEGGFVNSGQMFIARENGLSEYVGSFGNKTAVANNDQIVEGITVGVARGMQAVQKDTNVVIEATGDASGLLNFINFEQKKKDRQYGLG